MELLKTSLYQKHLNLKANMVDFAGYLMPLYYSSIQLEHNHVRNSAGIFDVSHMGELLIKGKDAYKFANYLLSSKITMQSKMIYALLLNEDGFIIDDLMVYPIDSENILIIANASNLENDYNWIRKQINSFDCQLINQSDSTSQIALQGPKSYELLSKLIKELPTFSMAFNYYQFENQKILISRSGYTGEDGFEIYGSSLVINRLWDLLIDLGAYPCGLGCRDTLRFEANMPLYGHEMSLSINPFEASLGFAVDFSKDNFIGREKLLLAKENLKRKIVGLQLLEKNVARASYQIFHQDKLIGYITTGYLSITAGIPIALAMIDIEYTKINTIVDVLIRNKYVKAQVRNKKFINKNNQIGEK